MIKEEDHMNLIIENLKSWAAPLYVRVRGALAPCRAYVVIDCQRSEVWTRVAIDGSTPIPVHNGLWYQVPVSPYVQGVAIYRALYSEDVQSMIESVVSGLRWRQTYKLTGYLTDEARAALHELEEHLRDLPTLDVWDPEDVELEPNDVRADSTDAELAALARQIERAVIENSSGSACVAPGLLERLHEVRDQLRQPA